MAEGQTPEVGQARASIAPPEPNSHRLVFHGHEMEETPTSTAHLAAINKTRALHPVSEQPTNLFIDNRSIAASWLLVLFVAPMIVALLIWLLVLLRRRAEQARHLVNSGSSAASGAKTTGQNDKLASGLLSPASDGAQRPVGDVKLGGAKVANRNGSRIADRVKSAASIVGDHNKSKGHFLLESSSATSSSSSTSSSSDLSTAKTSDGPSLANESLPHDSGQDSLLVANHSSDFKSLSSMVALVDHMHLYLVTLTYQEIFACLIGFTIAILNVVRMRNLFSCNLVIFLLISSKLLNLLTLTSFSVTKLLKLFQLEPLKTKDTSNNNNNTNTSNSNSESDKNSSENRPRFRSSGSQSLALIDDRTAIMLPATNQTSSASSDRMSPAGQTPATHGARPETELGGAGKTARPKQLDTTTTASTSSSSSLDEALRLRGRQPAGKRRPRSSQANDTTICRLIDKQPARRPDAQQAAPASPVASCPSAHRTSPRGESIGCSLTLLLLVSCLLALYCLYSRLMPLSSSGLQSTAQSAANQSTADWATISIYATPSSTTEATTRYSSDERPPPRNLDTGQSNPQAANESTRQPATEQPNYQATWASRFQQSSQLRHLIEHYELQNFLSLLLDTHLQTSRFQCTLSGANYTDLAKTTMTTIYALLMFSIFLACLFIQQIGNKRLRQFEMSSLPDELISQLSDNHNYRSPVLASQRRGKRRHHQQPPAHWQTDELIFGHHQELGMVMRSGGSNSRKCRYSDLLKQNLRHHQSSLEMRSSASRRPPAAKPQKLRAASSMSSLLATVSGPADATGSGKRWPPREVGGARPAGQAMAWLPLGSAVAHSLSSIAGEAALGGNRLASERLGAIGEHLAVECGGGGEREPRAGASLSPGARREGRWPAADAYWLPMALVPAAGQRTALGSDPPTLQASGPVQFYAGPAQCKLTKNKLNCSEIRRDLRLTQSVILFAQLLNHAPILLLLVLATLAQDSDELDTPLGGHWTSNHDNLFVWLTLIEALTFPLLLCILDSRLAKGLRRSLGCGGGGRSTGRGKSVVDSCGTQLSWLTNSTAASASKRDELVLGPSASYPDFMFACGARHMAPPTHLLQQRSLHEQQPKRPAASPPQCRESGADATDSLGANFALVCRAGKPMEPSEYLVGTADLMRSRRARYSELAGRRGHRHGHTSALLRATRRLFSRQTASHHLRRQRRDKMFTVSEDPSSRACADHRKSQLESGDMSPTSSLSTLIRKFNHDNYTSVCQQYEQRRQLMSAQDGGDLIIDQLPEDKPSELEAPPRGSSERLMLEMESEKSDGVLCRKGGLYYNYRLEGEQLAGAANKQRINPMLDGGTWLAMADGGRGDSSRRRDLSRQMAASKSIGDIVFGEDHEAIGLMDPNASKAPMSKAAKAKERAGQNKAKVGVSRGSKSSNNLLATAATNRDLDREKMEPAAKRIKQKMGSSNHKNNDKSAIIANISSVQELLSHLVDKENEQPALMGSLDANTKGDINEERPKDDEPGINNPNDSRRQQTSCSNQVKQLARLTLEAGGPPISHQRKGQHQRTGSSSNLLLDYATLRSMDDAMSLVSVSSEFEYHNLGRLSSPAPRPAPEQPKPAGQALGVTSAKGEGSSSGGSLTQRASSMESIGRKLASGSSSASSKGEGSSAAGSRRVSRAADLRFPSFLVSEGQQQAGELSAARAGRQPSRAKTQAGKTAGSHAPRTSSSLLNLTAAKFAALAAGKRPPAAGRPAQLQGSLPSESGNVRARIRRMELSSRQAATGGQLTASTSQLAGHQGPPAASGKLARPAGSQIPVISKLPVPVGQTQLSGSGNRRARGQLAGA